MKRWLPIAAVWCVAAAVSLVVASETAYGSVVLHLTATHGIHVGDVVVAAAAFTVAGVTTAMIVSAR